MTPKQRWMLLLSLLLGVMGLRWLDPVPLETDSSAGSTPQRHPAPVVHPAAGMRQIGQSKMKDSAPTVIEDPLRTTPYSDEIIDIFSGGSGSVATVPARVVVQPSMRQKIVPVVVAEAPPPPSAPNFPYIYLGQFIQDGAVTVFLAGTEGTISVKQGDVLQGQYRIESIKPPSMVVLYTPMNQKQTIPIMAAQ